MALIDIEIEDYLDEVDTRYLVQELQKRKDLKNYKIKLDQFDLPDFKNSNDIFEYIKKVLGLREWHDKDRVIAEIREL